jgi:DNA ligase-1
VGRPEGRSFDRFAATCEEIAKHGSRLKKVRVLAEFLRTLNDAELALAVRFLAADERVALGHATLREAATRATGWDAETFRTCRQAVGDTGETIALLLQESEGQEPLTLEEADQWLVQLASQKRTEAKVQLLAAIFRMYRAEAVKFFVKTITGSFRIGLQAKMVEEAIASASGAALEAVRQAANRRGDLAAVAVAAKRGELERMETRLFHPMEFMLAKPLEDWSSITDPEMWVVEDKFDGIRSQLHSDLGQVRIFSRGMEDITASYPEIVAAGSFLGCSAVLDGELLAFRDGLALSFQVLQQRLSRKRLTSKMLDEIPVVFLAYDVLYWDGTLMTDWPLAERVPVLESLARNIGPPIRFSDRRRLAAASDIEAEYLSARGRRNEGLMLKRLDSRYESGKRSGHWLKVKRPFGSLDVVVTAVEQGSGKRASLLSDYTFAVRAGGQFVNVGKAYSGLTDEELRELTTIFKQSTQSRFGRVSLVTPQVVLEVAFDGVQRSPRHKSGYALRFPRILRWRRDKRAAEADDLQAVEDLYLRSLHP